MKQPEEFAGDIAATMALGGEYWRDLDAPFASFDDGQGGTAELAAGTVEIPGGTVQFGVLDYGGGVTYLLAPATGAAKEKLADLALQGLAEAGALSLDDVMNEDNPYEEPSLAERVSVLEQWAGEAMADAETSAVPVAVDVEVPADYPDVAPEYAPVGEPAEVEPFSVRHIGTIKLLDFGKGYGVISPDGGGKEIFVPVTSVKDKYRQALAEGAKVTFRYTIKAGAKEEGRRRNPSQ
jgi:CspA family cold shock protein